MTFSRDMLGMMPQTITVNQFSVLSTDGYGARTYSTGTRSVKCYVEDKTAITKSPITGKEVISTRQIYAAPYDTTTGRVAIKVLVSDKITLPSTDYVPQTPPIINVTHYDDRQGYYAQVIYI